MEEPDPTTQVEMNTDVDELSAPKDNAREKQVDEKKVLDETKLFKETTTPEGEKDVEVNKAVDEATVREEINRDEKKKDGDENKAIEEIKHNEESSAEEGKNEELKKVTDEANASEGKKMDEKKILDAVDFFQETATAEGKVDGEGDNIVDEAKVSEETSKDENKKEDNENKAVEEITAIEEDKSVEDGKNEEVNVVNEEARVSDDNKKDDNEKDIGEETLEESNNTVGETLQVSKNTVGETLDESKNMVGETFDESKNIVRETLDESENCKGDIDEASKKIVAQKIFGMENITTDKKYNAKSLNVEDSSTMLNDEAIVDKGEKIRSSEDTNAEDKKNDKLTQVNIDVNVIDRNFQVEEKEGGKKNSIEEEIHEASKNTKWDINEVCKGDDVDKASGEENMKKTEEKGLSKGMIAEEEIKEAEKKGDKNNLKCEDVACKAEEEKPDIEEDIGTEDAKNANLTEEGRSMKELQNDVDASKVDESKMKVEEKNDLKDVNDRKSGKGMAEITDKEDKSDMKDASKLEKPNEPATEIEYKNNLENENDANKAEENNSAQDLKDENVTNKDKEVGEQSNSEADDVEMTDIEEKKSEVKLDVEREDRSENENTDVRMIEAEYAQAEDNPEDKVDQIKKEKDTNGGSRKKKRSRSRRKVSQRTEARDKKAEPKEEEKKESAKKPKVAILSSPAPSIERPVRERKSVERLVEVIEKEPERSFVVEKGFGTPLKNIPKVGYRLARKKPSELKLLHHVLFGRKGKLADFRNHVLQFSGFVWNESDEKQKTKVKERLNKCVKENLLSFCDLLCISVSKTDARKENLISKLLDFLSAPHSASYSLQSVDDQEITKSHKRRGGSNESASKRTDDVVAKSVSKGVKKSRGEEEYDDDNNEEEYGKEGNDSEDDEKIEQSESEKKYKSEKEEEKDEVEDMGLEMNTKSVESVPENSVVLKGRAKRKSRSKKTTSVKAPTKVTNSGKNDDSEEKVFARQKKIFGPLRKKSTSKSEVKQKSDSILEPKKKEKSDPILEPIKKEKSDPILEPKKKASSSLGPKEKSASVSISPARVTRLSESKGKSVSKLDSSEKNSTAEKSPVEKRKPEKSSRSNPSKEELRETICGILKKADFNTATFTDILNRLSTHYKANLTTRKASIKLLIQEELTKLADELEDNVDKKPSEQEAHRPRAKRARKSKV